MSSIKRHIPLPFQGNKSNRVDSFIEHIKSLSDDLTFVDLFGGSLYLSYVIHKLKPNAKVICNDFDNYRKRLDNVNTTNEILRAIRLINPNKRKEAKFTPQERDEIKRIINEFRDENWLDVLTLSNALSFSSMYTDNIEQLLSRQYYNRIPQRDYNVQWYINGLKGIEFVCEDWQQLYNKYKDKDNICFIADPPYFNTDQSSYKNKWTFTDSLNTLNILKHEHFVYYSSNKSHLLNIIEFLNHDFLTNPLKFTCITIQRAGANHHSKPWQDIMLIN